MEPKTEKTACNIGLLAHVDAGKTTLSEALLYAAGARRALGRVDHGDTLLDSDALERRRGITIFSKLARMETAHRRITLVDTPGHVDFSSEAERAMGVLDCAVLVISGTDGIQAHTLTLWRLLERYQVPVFLFLNKMDLPGKSREDLMAQLQKTFSAGCIDFSQAQIDEQCALCDEALLENYLLTGQVTEAQVRGLIAGRRVFPCLFGSALKMDGVEKLLDLLDRLAPENPWKADFAARVYKISRDPQGSRLTWMKLTGGSLRVRQGLRYVNKSGEACEEKIQQLRLYSGEKFTPVEEASAGEILAVTGLTGTYAGQNLGAEPPMEAMETEPVMTYRLKLPKGDDPVTVLGKLRQIEEEDPLLKLEWDEGLQEIRLRLMGRVQIQVLGSILQERFGIAAEFDEGRIFYKETIANTVEGVGHFEPLRHYAEVHLLLEPGQRGSGLAFSTRCPVDVLEPQYQNLVLTHLAEKIHRGVLTGAPITDMKITLLTGRAHVKHTEGGDFRQATYRAVRQGLMQAESVLLEPWYAFTLTVPANQVGRGITDIRAMGGEAEPPEQNGEFAVLRGRLPVASLGDYPQEVAAYTQGRGSLQLSPDGYDECHNAEEVIAQRAYDPEADTANTPDSVFCAHGSGVIVKWDHVFEQMHLESALKADRPGLIVGNLQPDDRALEAILRREFGEQTTTLYRPRERLDPQEKLVIRPPRKTTWIVDGYNMIFCWPELADTAKSDLSAARRHLLNDLSSFAGFRKCTLIVVFDGYKVPGNPGEKERFHNISVVYTRENQTADAYIESLVEEIGKNDQVKVATSDGLIQLSSLRSGVLRVSAREMEEEVRRAKTEMRKLYGRK